MNTFHIMKFIFNFITGQCTWEEMWAGGLAKGQAFDVGMPSQTLMGALKRMPKPAESTRALVPGCGRAYDALALARHGFTSVHAIDLSKTACEAARAFLDETGDPLATNVELLCADFFEHDCSEGYDLIWDCTFLCALDPSVRERWAAKQATLLKPDGKLLTCIFPIGTKSGGPPYALSVELLKSLLLPVGLAPVEIREDLPDDEQHRPGGALATSSPFRTAVGTWMPTTGR